MNNTKTNIPYTLTDQTIIVFFDGNVHQLAKTAKSEAILREAIETGDLTDLRKLTNPGESLKAALDGSGVGVVNGTVSYRGKRISGK